MDLRTYIQTLQAHLSACSPDLGDDDSVLGVLYEAYSESSAMYDDEIKEAFHALYANRKSLRSQNIRRSI